MEEHRTAWLTLGGILVALGAGTVIGLPISAAEYPYTHFPQWPILVGIIGLVIGLYLVAAIIWALPLPGGSKASKPPAIPSVTQPPAPTAQSLRIEVGNGPDFECGI